LSEIVFDTKCILLCYFSGMVHTLSLAGSTVLKGRYRVIKKSLCTWLLKYRKLQSQSDSLAADRQGDIRLTLTPSIIPNSNYVIMVSDRNCLKYFCVFFYCNHQVHRDILITLYHFQHHKTISRCHQAFGRLVVSMLASGTQDRGFAPGRSLRIFRAKKAVCHMSQICGMSKNPITYRGSRSYRLNYRTFLARFRFSLTEDSSVAWHRSPLEMTN
jgi:hypothetical protein